MACKNPWEIVADYFTPLTGVEGGAGVAEKFGFHPCALSLEDQPQAPVSPHANPLVKDLLANPRQDYIPQVDDPAELSFTDAGDAAHLGGTHPKRLYTDQHGRTWMFKPEESALGRVRARAEAFAASLVHRLGYLTPPVFAVTLDGSFGTIQPMVENCGPLPDDVLLWTKAQIAGVAALHPLTYLASDQDRRADNHLILPNGQPIPIDMAQAMKFFGNEDMQVPHAPFLENYHLNLWSLVRQKKIALSREEAEEILEPSFQAVEAMPDEELVELARPLAEEAIAAKKVFWVRRFQDQLSNEEPGFNELLETEQAEMIASRYFMRLVERKHSLRKVFAQLLDQVYGQKE